MLRLPFALAFALLSVGCAGSWERAPVISLPERQPAEPHPTTRVLGDGNVQLTCAQHDGNHAGKIVRSTDCRQPLVPGPWTIGYAGDIEPASPSRRFEILVPSTRSAEVRVVPPSSKGRVLVVPALLGAITTAVGLGLLVRYALDPQETADGSHAKRNVAFAAGGMVAGGGAILGLSMWAQQRLWPGRVWIRPASGPSR